MREDIQSLLNEITNVETSTEVPDDMLEKSKTYFSFSLTENFLNSDYENNQTMQVDLVGYVKRIISTDEDTLSIVDNATKDIMSKLKDLNIRCSYQDVSIANNVQKIRISGRGLYNQINNELV